MNHKSKITWTFHPASNIANDKEIISSWNTLNTTQQTFMTAEAISCALENFGNGQEKLAVGKINENIICMGIMHRIDAFRWISFQPSQLPLGAFLIASHLDFENTTTSLLRALPGVALVLSITQIDPLFTPRPTDTSTLRLNDYIETGWIELTGTFDEYWAVRGKNLRQNLRKQVNKIAAENIKTDFRSYTKAKEMADAVQRYGELESAGWKAELGTAIHVNNSQGHFYTQFLKKAAAQGNAAVYEYWLDNKLAASNLCIKNNGTTVILKTTYDEKYTQLSPAFLLLREEIQLAYSSGETLRIEFYGKKKDWHTRWTDQFRTLYHATLYRHPLIRKIAEIRHTNHEKIS